MKNYKHILPTSLMLLVLGLSIAQGALALGQITKPIMVTNALRAQVIEETLIIFNSKDTSELVDLVVEGDIVDWVTFFETEARVASTTVLALPASDQFTTGVTITVPESIPNGTYIGQLIVRSRPPDEEEVSNTVTVRQQIARDVTIIVTDEEILNVVAEVIPVTYAPGANEALAINIHYTNNGNVDVRPNVELKIRIGETMVMNAIFPYPESEESVQPLSVKIIPIQWQTAGQEPGMYRAEVAIRMGEETLHEDSFRFEVGGTTDLGKKIGGSNPFGGISLIPSLIFLAIVIVILFIIRAVKKAKKSPDAPTSTA